MHLAFLDLPVHLVNKENQDLLDPEEQEVIKVHVDQMENQGLKVE